MKIVLLASGTGSLARAICQAGISGVEVVALISDKKSPALDVAQDYGIPSEVIEMQSDRTAWDRAVLTAVQSYSPDLVVSVGFMRILSADFLQHCQTINTHPALLPLFPGAHAVRDALAAHASVTGTTVHWVDEGVDTGPVIAQKEVAILASDDEATLHERIKIAERLLIVETLSQFAAHGIPEITNG